MTPRASDIPLEALGDPRTRERDPRGRRVLLFCKRGHPQTPENRLTRANGTGYCKLCSRARNEMTRALKRESLRTRSHCELGHALTRANLSVRSDGSTACLVCRRERRRAPNEDPARCDLDPSRLLECPVGHAYTRQNTFYVDGRKRCVICHRSAGRVVAWSD